MGVIFTHVTLCYLISLSRLTYQCEFVETYCMAAYMNWRICIVSLFI